MALATDLMGLGLPGRLAARIAVGGVGAVAVAAAGSGFSTATRIKQEQRLTSVTGADGTTAVSLPAVSGDVNIGDMFIIHNSDAADSLQVYGSTGVVIYAGDSTSVIPVLARTTLVVFPTSTTAWVGGRLT